MENSEKLEQRKIKEEDERNLKKGVRLNLDKGKEGGASKCRVTENIRK